MRCDAATVVFSGDLVDCGSRLRGGACRRKRPRNADAYWKKVLDAAAAVVPSARHQHQEAATHRHSHNGEHIAEAQADRGRDAQGPAQAGKVEGQAPEVLPQLRRRVWRRKCRNRCAEELQGAAADRGRRALRTVRCQCRRTKAQGAEVGAQASAQAQDDPSRQGCTGRPSP